MLESWATACNGVKNSLQSLQEGESSSSASVTRCSFLFNLCFNRVARKVAGRLQRVTCPLCNLSHNFCRLATIAQSRVRFCFLQECFFEYTASCSSRLQCVNMSFATYNGFLFQRCKTAKIAFCNTRLMSVNHVHIMSNTADYAQTFTFFVSK